MTDDRRPTTDPGLSRDKGDRRIGTNLPPPGVGEGRGGGQYPRRPTTDDRQTGTNLPPPGVGEGRGGGQHPLAAELAGASCEPDAYGHCSTCADEARQARVLRVDAAAGLALVDTGGATGEVDISLVDELAPDDLVLIHGGVAIAKL